MSKLRQILKMYAQRCNKAYISQTVGVSRNTVKSHLRTFHWLNRPMEELLQLDDAGLDVLFKSVPVVRNENELTSLYEFFKSAEKKLARRGTSILDLFKEYALTHAEPLGKTSFYVHYKAYARRVSPSMHMEHKAGDKMFIDFTGEKYSYVNTDTGEIQQAEVYVAILGASQLTYIEAVESQKVDDLIYCCIHALEYFGGSPLAIVPDNLKSAVTTSHRYEPKLNENFESFARHYGMAVVPARAYKPKDKALVENAVKISYGRVFKNLGDDIVPLTTLNERIKILLEQHNNTLLSGRDFSRRQRFEEIEKEELQPLPALQYELRKQVHVTVLKTGYVMLSADKHYYSVPFTYIGKKVKILFSKSLVEIFYKYELIAAHKRIKSRYNYSTVSDHLASQHQAILEWNPEKFLKDARDIDPVVEQYIHHVLTKKHHPEQAYRTCLGILSFAKRKDHATLIAACERALYLQRYNFATIESIILGGLDKLEWEKEETRSMPKHDNIRGEDYFQ
jgi:transposase